LLERLGLIAFNQLANVRGDDVAEVRHVLQRF
jgi:predicted flap endonuclease-1-like 5' DNA nuclease